MPIGGTNAAIRITVETAPIDEQVNAAIKPRFIVIRTLPRMDSKKERIAIYPNSSEADRRDRLGVGLDRFATGYLTANTGPLPTGI